MNKKILVLTPHSDDSELGMAGTIAKHCANGDEVIVALVCNHNAERKQEFANACRATGAKPVFLSDEGYCFDDGKMGESPKELVCSVDRLKNEFKPDIMYLPYPSVHQDHCAVYEAGLRSSRLSLNEGEWFIKSVLVYKEPVSQIDIYNTGLVFSVFSDISGEHIKKKMEAIACHKSQILQYPHPSSPEYLDYEARAEGGKCGVEHAEVFAPVRLTLGD